MYHELASPDYVQLVYRDDSCLIIARWMRPVSLDEARHGYEAILRAAEAHDCRHWFLDLRRRNILPAGTLEWLYDTFFAEAAHRLRGRLAIAYLMSPSHLDAVSEAETDVFAIQAANQAASWQHFTDERLANEWLTQQLRLAGPPPAAPE